MKHLTDEILNNWTKEFAEGNRADFSHENSKLEQEFKAYNKTWKTLNEMQDIEKFDTDKAWNKLFSKIEGEDTVLNIQSVKKINRIRSVAIAASIALIVGIAGLQIFKNQSDLITQSNKGLTAQMVSMPDGSQVYLNVNSEIIYSKNFNKSKLREVQLKGEAFFKVAKDKDHPFIIQAENSFVKVLGTSFNVNANTNKVEVIVSTGKVEVYHSNSSNEHLILLPGDRAVLEQNQAIIKNSNFDDNYLAWLNHKLVFKSMDLSNVVSNLINAYHCDIVLADSSMGDLKITSTFDNDSLDEILKSISIALNLNVENDGKKYTLVLNR